MCGDRIQCVVVVSVRRCGNRGSYCRVVAGVYGSWSWAGVDLVAMVSTVTSENIVPFLDERRREGLVFTCP